jgi:nucleotide-binding universal stress UspA family protein
MSYTILLPVDGTPSSARAAELLEGYRGEARDTKVVVLNVQSRPLDLWPDAPIDVRAMESALLESGQRIVEAAMTRLRAAGLQADSAVRLGFAADGILREAKSSGAGMIIMGTRGHGMAHGFALGSVAMRVAQGSAVPLCLLTPNTRLPVQLGRSLRVMLAADGSEPALHAAKALASWRNWLGQLDVQLVYVQQPLTFLQTVLPPHDDVIEQWSTRSAETATRPIRDLFTTERISTHLHLSVGDAATEIAQLASQAKCELLVLGTRGLGAAHHAFIGSVALKVAAHAAMPVMLVR